MDDEVAALAALLGNDPTGWMPFSYGYLKSAVQEHVDGVLSLKDLDESLSRLEMALWAVRAQLQQQRNGQGIGMRKRWDIRPSSKAPLRWSRR